MISWVCHRCRINWPPNAMYATCPACHKGTVIVQDIPQRLSDGAAMAKVDELRNTESLAAKKAERARRFDEQYEEREAAKFRKEIEEHWAGAY